MSVSVTFLLAVSLMTIGAISVLAVFVRKHPAVAAVGGALAAYFIARRLRGGDAAGDSSASESETSDGDSTDGDGIIVAGESANSQEVTA